MISSSEWLGHLPIFVFIRSSRIKMWVCCRDWPVDRVEIDDVGESDHPRAGDDSLSRVIMG